MYFLCFFLTTYIYSLWSYFSKSSNTPNLPQQKHPEMYFSCKGCHGPLCLLSFLSGALCLLCFWDKISKICGFCVYSHNNNVTFTHCILRVLVWINLELVAFVNHPRWPRSSWVCSAIAGLLSLSTASHDASHDNSLEWGDLIRLKRRVKIYWVSTEYNPDIVLKKHQWSNFTSI